MKHRTLLMMAVIFPWFGACAGTGEQTGGIDVRGIGMVVEDKLAPGASTKEGVQGVSDTGQQLFAHARLTTRGGGTGTYGGGRVPRWVHVTWREQMTAYLPGRNGQYTTGKVVGDYTVDVLNRIPTEVFTYAAAAPGRAIVLRFRIKDDGVLLAWDVQELVRHPKGGSGWVYSMHGGDFPCETSPYQARPNCTDGPLEKAPWYNPLWSRK